MELIFVTIPYAIIRLFCEKDPSLLYVIIGIIAFLCLLGLLF